MRTRQLKSRSANTKKKSAKVIQLDIFRQPRQRETEKLINGIWAAAASALWFNKTFNAKEAELHKELISEHFFNGKETKKNFRDLIERISLAKRYVARKRGRYISKPQDYLNIHYPLGLAGTETWLQQVNEIRKEVPEYNKGITTLAKALLAFIEKPNAASFEKGRKLLTEQSQFDLLQIYYNTIIHLQYNF